MKYLTNSAIREVPLRQRDTKRTGKLEPMIRGRARVRYKRGEKSAALS